MMVHLGLADGMVSGAAHTTAHTINQSFEIIKTVPGTAIVSSVFLMCLARPGAGVRGLRRDPDPTAPQLADIAIPSADTASQFGIHPRIAMLSYSTGASGSGEDIDKVRAATALVRSQQPDLLVDCGRNPTSGRLTRRQHGPSSNRAPRPGAHSLLPKSHNSAAALSQTGRTIGIVHAALVRYLPPPGASPAACELFVRWPCNTPRPGRRHLQRSMRIRGALDS